MIGNPANTLFGMQCCIFGMAAFLVMVEVGGDEMMAANVMMLAVAGGILVMIAPALTYSYRQLRSVWGVEE